MVVEIPLTKGFTAIVDDVDADLAAFKWSVTGGRATYAGRRSNGKYSLMHRGVMERVLNRTLSDKEICDHINGNSLDNRRQNLRLVTSSQNAINRRIGKHSTSGFKGVSWNKNAGKWQAYICINGKQSHLGYFTDPATAHAAYCEAGREHFGEFFNSGEVKS